MTDTILQLWNAINAAWPDTVRIAPHVAPEFRLAGASGAVYDRTALLQYLVRQAAAPAGVANSSMSRRDVEVRLFGTAADIGIVTAEITDIVPAGDAMDTVITRVTDVFARHEGRWLWVTSHESFVRPPRELPARWRRPELRPEARP